MFKLHPRLKEDCFVLGHFELSLLLLMNDANYPWFILVPQREGLSEIHELSEDDQQQLARESSCLSRALAVVFGADKMNVAALGNVVPQLHIHHIVRFRDDPAWPDPVWGKLPARPYGEDERESVAERVLNVLQDDLLLFYEHSIRQGDLE